MTQDVHDALGTWFAQHEIERQLHDVPPHAVYAVTVDGRRAVCKVARGETADVGAEAAAMAHADRHTALPVPRVLAAREDAFVATWLAGLDSDVDPDDPADARSLGRGLARLHAATEDAFSRPGFPELGPAWDPDGRFDSRRDDAWAVLAVDDRLDWHAVAREFLEEIREYLATIGLADPADEVLALLDDYPDLFEGAGTPVLCHGNLHPEHAALDRGGTRPELAALIDFEHALVAPAEYDFWRTAIPLFHEPGSGATDTLSAFRAGYESVRDLPLGVDRRRDAWWLVIFVSFLLALDVQNRGIGPDERERAAGTADLIDDLAGEIRERRG